VRTTDFFVGKYFPRAEISTRYLMPAARLNGIKPGPARSARNLQGTGTCRRSGHGSPSNTRPRNFRLADAGYGCDTRSPQLDTDTAARSATVRNVH